MESGQFDVVVEPISQDEFADVSDAFTRMVVRLKQTTAIKTTILDFILSSIKHLENTKLLSMVAINSGLYPKKK